MLRTGALVIVLGLASASATADADQTTLRRDMARAARTAAALETRALRAEASLAAARRRLGEQASGTVALERRLAEAEAQAAAARSEQAALRAALALAQQREARNARTAERASGLRRIEAPGLLRFLLPDDYFADEPGLGRRLGAIYDAASDRPGARVRIACHWDPDDDAGRERRRCAERVFLLRNAMAEEGLYTPPSDDRMAGAAEPLGDARDRFAREANRRIEIELLFDPRAGR